MQNVIEMKDVSKSFGRVRALDQFSLNVPAGVVCALLGENGAGKTTAIRVMLGLETPGAGNCRVLGLESSTAGLELRRRVGYVSERPVLYDWMTVGEIGFRAHFGGTGTNRFSLGRMAGSGMPMCS